MKSLNIFLKEGFFDNIGANKDILKLYELGFKQIPGEFRNSVMRGAFYYESKLSGSYSFMDPNYDPREPDAEVEGKIKNINFYLIPEDENYTSYILYMVFDRTMFIYNTRYMTMSWASGDKIREINMKLFQNQNYDYLIDNIYMDCATLPEIYDLEITGSLKQFLQKLDKINFKELMK